MVSIGELVTSGFTGKFLVGWFLSYRMFQYLNYKSIESLLLVYPQADTRFRLIAPRMVTNDRCGEIIPYPIFSKFEKQGLRITTEVINLADPVHRQAPGFEYWKSTIMKTFAHNISETPSHVPIPSHQMDFYPAPYHTVLYDAMIQLYKFGGVYSDLSWIHLKPLPGLDKLENEDEVAGYAIKVLCNEQELPSEPTRAFKRPPFYCKASSLLIFSKQHPVLQCMIQRYAQSDFLSCLNDDVDAQGAFCLQKHMHECFAADTSITNILARSVVSSSSSVIDFENCYKEEYKNKHHHSEQDTTDSHKSTANGKSNFAFSSSSSGKPALIPPDCKVLNSEHTSQLLFPPSNSVSTFKSSKASQSSSQTGSYRIGQDQSVIWMNAAGYSVNWIIPEEKSLMAEIIQRNNDALRQSYQIRTNNNVNLTDYVPPPSSQYKLNASPSLSAGIASTREIPATITPANSLNTASLLNPSLHYQKGRAEMSTVLTYVLPGFMKSASTYIYGTIDNHPWVVRALRGFDYKEAGCYSSEFMGGVVGNATSAQTSTGLLRQSDRMLCYPFLEANIDRVVYGDGSIVYAPRKDVIHHLLHDNPHLKILFSIRDPIERAISIHRFDYGNLKTLSFANINDCILSTLNLKIYNYWYSLALKVVKTGQSALDKEQAREKLADKFMTDMSKMFQLVPTRMRCFRIIHDSLYFPQIFHWYKATTASNIRVLDVQRLQTSKLTSEEKIQALAETPILHDTNIRRVFLGHLVSDNNNQSIIGPTGTHDASQELKHKRVLAENKQVTIDRNYLLYQWNAIYKYVHLEF